MKKIKFLMPFLLIFLTTSCVSTKEIEGYWCNYEEKAIITLLLDKNITEAQRIDIEDTINTITNLETYDPISAEELASSLDGNADELYDTYFIYLKNSDYIDDSLLLLQTTKGVNTATKSIIKNNLSIYHLKDGKFTYNIDLDNNDLEKSGKYKVRKNKITFDDGDVDTIYIKDDFLCLDDKCNKILIETNNKCEAN